MAQLIKESTGNETPIVFASLTLPESSGRARGNTTTRRPGGLRGRQHGGRAVQKRRQTW